MLWYNTPEVVQVMIETSCGWAEEERRRSSLRLIRSGDGH